MPAMSLRAIAVACGLMMVEASRRENNQEVVAMDATSTRMQESARTKEELRAAVQRLDSERTALTAALAAISHKETGTAATERSTGEWVSIVYRVLTILFGLMVFGKLLKAPMGLSGFFVNASEEAIVAYSKHVLESPGSFSDCPDKQDAKELTKNIYQGILLGARAYMSALTGVTIVYAYSLFFIPFKDMYPLFLGVAGWFAVLGVTNISTILFASGPYVYPVANNYPGAIISIVFTSLAGYSCYASQHGL